MSVLDIARELRKSYSATQTKVNRKGCGRSDVRVQRRRWSAAEADRVVELAAAGTSMADIAAALGRSEVATMSQAARLGVAGVSDPKLWSKARTGRRKAGNSTNYGTQGTTSKTKDIRDCLTCRLPFMSEWKGNRRCQPCEDRTASEGLDD
jgi:transposase-like protein